MKNSGLGGEAILMSVTMISLLSGSAFLAGLVDTVAGGGGLITVPALLMSGMPPALALGTNKLQACFGSFTATAHFVRRGHLSVRESIVGILACLIGASAGSIAILNLHPSFLKAVMPILLILALIYMLFTPRVDAPKTPRLSKTIFYLIFGFALGFYDGFFGPGTGSLWVVALMFFLGSTAQTGSIYAKIFNFTSNIVSLAWFMIGGHIAIILGLCMGVGQLLGARVGAQIVLSQNGKWIRPIFLLMVSAMLLELIYRYWISG